LIAYGTDVEAKSNDGISALLFYASIGRFEEIQLLLNYGCNIEFDIKDGMTALHFAVEGASSEVAKTLLEFGIDPDIRTLTDGDSVLKRAIYTDNVNLVELLLEYDAVTEVIGSNESTAILCAIEHFAVSNKNQIGKVFDYFASNWSSAVTTLDPHPCSRYNSELMSLLLKNSADLNTYTAYGWSLPDFVLLAGRQTDVVISLVEAAAQLQDPSVKLLNTYAHQFKTSEEYRNSWVERHIRAYRTMFQYIREKARVSDKKTKSYNSVAIKQSDRASVDLNQTVLINLSNFNIEGK
jgi:ankyrin repeat protein